MLWRFRVPRCDAPAARDSVIVTTANPIPVNETPEMVGLTVKRGTPEKSMMDASLNKQWIRTRSDGSSINARSNPVGRRYDSDQHDNSSAFH